MKVDIDYLGREQVSITYETDVFNDDRDFAIGLSILTNFCTEFELEPDLTFEEFKELIEQIRSKDKASFKVCIDEEGIEILLD